MEIQKRTIDGIEFEITPYSCTEANRFLVSKLGKIFAPILMSFFKADKDADVRDLAPTMALSFSQLGESEVDDITLRLLRNAVAQGAFGEGGKMQRLDLNSMQRIDQVFAGPAALGTLYRVLLFSLEVNYRGFIVGLGLSA
jgi:hypothetical protein